MIESDNRHAIRLFQDLGLPTTADIAKGETTLLIDMPAWEEEGDSDQA